MAPGLSPVFSSTDGLRLHLPKDGYVSLSMRAVAVIDDRALQYSDRFRPVPHGVVWMEPSCFFKGAIKPLIKWDTNT